MLIQSDNHYPFIIDRLDHESQQSASVTDPRLTAHCFYQPLDHYDPGNNVTFCQRYWVSLEHWSRDDDAPVFVLDGGETGADKRLFFLTEGLSCYSLFLPNKEIFVLDALFAIF